MGFLKTLILPLACVSCLACSQPPPPPPPPPHTVFDPLTQQLERAKGVQATVDQNSAATREAVTRQERGDDAP